MKRETVLCLFLLSVFVSGCSSSKQLHKDLPYIDVRRNYPEKEINLTDIADVTYLYLNSDDADYLYSGGIEYVTQNTIVVIDRSSGSVLFFSKEGDPKSRFNRRGRGQEEYLHANSVMYDEATDDVYITPIFADYINVYSSSGEYKRRLTLPQSNFDGQMILFDDRSIMVYDNTKTLQNVGAKFSGDRTAFTEPVDSTFFLISKTDGAVLEYIKLPSTNIDCVSVIDINGAFFGEVNYTRVRKCPDGLFLYNPGTDTIFLYGKDKSLTPYMHQKPLLSNLNPMIVMNNCMDAGRFQLMSVRPYTGDGEYSPARYYMRDKTTGEIFRQKITLPDYKKLF